MSKTLIGLAALILKKERDMTENSYFDRLTSILSNSDLQVNIASAINLIESKIKSGNTIWIMGNGGSSSTAEHFETDLSFVRRTDNRITIRASALTSNSSLTTAISNDIGYKQVFSHQLNRKAATGDVCFIISASGNSDNLIEAVRTSKNLGLTTVGLVGFDGGEIMDSLDLRILTKSNLGDYGPVEDCHLAVCHLIAEQIGLRLFKDQ
jgi:D-sedoheptulose 7-phosphate isomerase